MTGPHQAQCHCGTVQFTVALSDGLSTARRCTCSYCTMRGAVAVSAPLDGIHFTAGKDNLTLYQFNTRTAKHFFCRTCGIYTHHQRRSNPDEYGVNMACLAGLSPWDLSQITVNDGQSHPSDGAPARVDGVLRYEKAPT
jgi:hypothetical protein